MLEHENIEAVDLPLGDKVGGVTVPEGKAPKFR